MILAYLLFTFSLVWHPRFIQAAPDNRGKEFVIGFMNNYNSYKDECEIFITTSRTTNVNVQVTSPKYSNPSINEAFTVVAGFVKQLKISNNFRMVGTSKDTKGIRIVADDEVVVYGNNREPYTADAFLALPVDVLGTEYYAHVWYPPASGFQMEMMVVGVHDGTAVGFKLADHASISVTYNGVTYSKTDWVNVTLNKYETFMILGDGDFTGSHIVSSKPITAFSGNQLCNIGPGSRDHLVEQLVPVPNWGKIFAITPTPERTTGDYYRFLASEDDTSITVDGQISGSPFSETITIAKKAGFAQKHYSSHLFASVKANKPITVVQFVHSQVREPADPAMIIIPPVEQFAADYTFTTPKYSYGSYINYFSFVVDKTLKDGLRINDNPFPANTVYNDIPGTNFVGGFLNIAEGTYTVRHQSPLSTFGGFLFGRANAESYGFPTGMRLAPINSVCVPSSSSVGDGIDNDCDGKIDEELCTTENNSTDDDGDGLVDEDCVTPFPINGNWASWEPWSSCMCISGSASNGGTQSRQRTCTDPAPKYDGKQCAGQGTESQSCTPNNNCAVDGSWSLWGSWTSCTVTCGGGTFTRTRTCTNPAPVNGADCPNSGTETENCNTQNCPINGGWGSWSVFGDCSNSCGPGNQNRTRQCNSPVPQYGGVICTGDDTDIQTCTGTCKVDGNWGNWQNWGACTQTCDSGVRSRSRVCNNPAPANGGLPCDSSSSEVESCNTAPCPTVASGSYQQLCPTGFFTCESGTIRCIQDNLKCDCQTDCADGSDESTSYASCDPSAASACLMRSSAKGQSFNFQTMLIILLGGVFGLKI